MSLVANTSNKIIGIGSTVLLPGDMKPLEAPFSTEHPTVKYYIRQGWLAVGGNSTPVASIAPQAAAHAAEDGISMAQLHGVAAVLGLDLIEGEDAMSLFKRITEAKHPQAEVGGSVPEEDFDEEPEEDFDDNKDASGSVQLEGLTARAVTRMNTADLQATATALGLEFAPGENRAALIDRINGHLFPNMQQE